MHIDQWIAAIPPLAVYLTIGLIIGLESLGIPLPGEIALVSATLLTLHPSSAVQWEWIAVAAMTGAIVGDSIGYSIGRKFGKPLFVWLGKKFPKHFGPNHLATAERAFERWGMWAVFFGRFIALLRIFAGPLAGALKMPYAKFLTANALGGICWAGGTTAAIHYLGEAASHFLSQFAWIGLGVALLFGIGVSLFIKHRAGKAHVSTEDTAIEAADKH
ncbi:DedA family protein [Kutzneria viridogrisea]|uniref:DedA family protein n=1 Tax=Kutzneria TaxID=43356 RepID=UPI00046D88D8|nr:DedA family protein [Kutzneria albida]